MIGSVGFVPKAVGFGQIIRHDEKLAPRLYGNDQTRQAYEYMALTKDPEFHIYENGVKRHNGPNCIQYRTSLGVVVSHYNLDEQKGDTPETSEMTEMSLDDWVDGCLNASTSEAPAVRARA